MVKHWWRGKHNWVAGEWAAYQVKMDDSDQLGAEDPLVGFTLRVYGLGFRV
jgi:hypothetical protein